MDLEGFGSKRRESVVDGTGRKILLINASLGKCGGKHNEGKYSSYITCCHSNEEDPYSRPTALFLNPKIKQADDCVRECNGASIKIKWLVFP